MREVASCEQEQLIEFRQGSVVTRDAAFEALFRLHQRAVRGWILRIVRNAAAADELTVETFWRIYRAHARFEPERGFEPWARRIATRAALDWLRARKPEYAMANEFFADLPSPARTDPAVSAEIRQKDRAGLRALAAGLADCGHAGGDRGTPAQGSCRGAGNLGHGGKSARLSRASLAEKRFATTGDHAMKRQGSGIGDQRSERLERLLRRSAAAGRR